MKMVKILSVFTLCLCGQIVSAQQLPTPNATQTVDGIGASIANVPTLKALVVEQIDSWEVSVSGASVLDINWEKRQAAGVYTPQTKLGPNLKKLSELVSAQPLQVAVSNPNDALNAYVSYFSVPDQNGARNQLFYGNQSFRLIATAKGEYKFPPDIRPSLKMVDKPVVRMHGVQLSSVKVTERSPDGQIIDQQYLDVSWQSDGTPAVAIPAYLVEGERQGEIVFNYWISNNRLQSKIFDLGTGESLEQTVASGTVSASIDGVIVVDNDDIIVDLPEGGRVPLFQLIVPAPRNIRIIIRGIVDGTPESASGLKVRRVGQEFEWSNSVLPPKGSSGQVEPGVYWVIPDFKSYGKDLPPEFVKPQPTDGGGRG